MNRLLHALILAPLVVCLLAPWIVSYWQARRARARWRLDADLSRTTRERIEEIEQRDEQAQARRGSNVWPGRVRRRLEE